MTAGQVGAHLSPALSVSVVVRSFKRPAALLELVDRLCRQAYPCFEVIIFEQSGDPKLVAELHARRDHRLQVVVSPPCDPPRARNEAVRHARGDVLIFIDDDDLPIGTDWISLHLRNYSDPTCVGVAGRATGDATGKKRPLFPRVIRALAMRHTFFKDTVALNHNTIRKTNIDFLVGTNASVRRTLIERIGGWDEGIPMHEEQSFAFKFHRHRSPGEHFVFDPGPTIQRRTDIPGGLERRTRKDWARWELETRLFYYERVVGHYFPVRYRLLCPLFVLRGVQQVLFWIWDGDNRHRGFFERMRATIDLVPSVRLALALPRFSASDVRRVSALQQDARADLGIVGIKETLNGAR
jgi:glycosyltransferase involved in cell wall biosynthesis